MYDQYEHKLYNNSIFDYQPHESDLNEVYFIYYKYLKMQKEIRYSADRDFFALCNDIFISKIKSFTKSFNDYKKIDKSKALHMVDEALKFPFLFKNSYLEKYPTTDFHLFEFIEHMIDSEYLEEESINLGVFADYQFVEFTSVFNYKDGRFPYYEINSNVKTSNFGSVGFMVGFNLPLKKYRTSFSYLLANVSLSYAQLAGIDSEIPKKKELYVYDPKSGKVFDGNYTFSENPYYMSFSLSLATPFIFVVRTFSLEAGLTGIYSKFTSDYTVNRSITSSKNMDSNDLKEHEEKLTLKDSKTFVYPTIAAEYEFTNNVSIKLVSFIPHFIRLQLLYKLDLLYE